MDRIKHVTLATATALGLLAVSTVLADNSGSDGPRGKLAPAPKVVYSLEDDQAALVGSGTRATVWVCGPVAISRGGKTRNVTVELTFLPDRPNRRMITDYEGFLDKSRVKGLCFLRVNTDKQEKGGCGTYYRLDEDRAGRRWLVLMDQEARDGCGEIPLRLQLTGDNLRLSGDGLLNFGFGYFEVGGEYQRQER